ncbi:MAG: DUF2490 domain-containing protein [Vicinamibacterales bacterium]
MPVPGRTPAASARPQRPGATGPWRRVAAALLLAAAGAVPAGAQPAPDRQVWVQVLALGQLSEQWRSHLEVQPRWFDDGSELGLTIVRTALGRRVSPRITAFLGYAWVPRTFGEGVRHEQRIWQQLSIAGPALGAWGTSARVRLEQRWLDPWNGPSHRLRTLVRAQRAVAPGSPWGVWTYDELMVTLADTTRGPARGFDRNRLAAGGSRRLSPLASIDAGYVWERAVAGAGRRNDHIAFGALNLTWPRR